MASAAGPNIITDGLVLHLDAANTNSYPGSGTTWTDISGKGHNGTLTNGPTFNSGDMGTIVFDGSNDTVTLSANSDFDFGTGDFTIEGFFNKSATTANLTLVCSENYYATGYNGNPSGFTHCIDEPCEGSTSKSGTDLDKCQAIHAEQNALLQCKDVYSIDRVYTTLEPCIHCIKLLLVL